MAPQLCLGTVQFGLPYGVTNDSGQVRELEVRSILSLAAQAGIQLLDTAQVYGSSETVLGRCWPLAAPRRLISKLLPMTEPKTWELSFQVSLRRLATSSLDAFLLHRSADLTGSNGDLLLTWLESLRSRGLVKRIGVSIYDASELDALPLDRLQLVQLPLSLYDQRFLKDGTIDDLCRAGLEIHARSTFLQGLLLQDPERWPRFLSSPFQDHHRKLKNYLRKYQLTLLDAAIGFSRSCEALEAVLVGVLSVEEMREVLQAWQKPFPAEFGSLFEWAWENAADLDPRFWPT